MRYIKRFESNENDLKVGDYVIIKNNNKDEWYSSEYLNFLSDNIGVIKKIVSRRVEVEVEFDKPYNNGKNNDACNFSFDQIEFSSSNKEELQLKMDARKYNL